MSNPATTRSVNLAPTIAGRCGWRCVCSGHATACSFRQWRGMEWFSQKPIDSGHLNSQMGDRSGCSHCNFVIYNSMHRARPVLKPARTYVAIRCSSLAGIAVEHRQQLTTVNESPGRKPKLVIWGNHSEPNTGDEISPADPEDGMPGLGPSGDDPFCNPIREVKSSFHRTPGYSVWG